MGELLNIVTPLHKATKRDYLARMVDDKVPCMLQGEGVRIRLLGRRPPVWLWWLQVSARALEAGGRGADQAVWPEAGLAGCWMSAAARHFCSMKCSCLSQNCELVGFDISNHGLASRHPDFKGRLFQAQSAGEVSVRRQGIRSRHLARLFPQPAHLRVAGRARRGSTRRQAGLRHGGKLPERVGDV